jgi:translation initiation factor 2 gamma subunit (eIF-2gamma)
MSGSVEVVARIFTEFGQDKKTKEKVEICRIVVGIDAPEHGTAWNAMNSGALLQQASVMKARVESAMKARNKREH